MKPSISHDLNRTMGCYCLFVRFSHFLKGSRFYCLSNVLKKTIVGVYIYLFLVGCLPHAQPKKKIVVITLLLLTKASKPYSPAVIQHLFQNRMIYTSRHGYDLIYEVGDMNNKCKTFAGNYVHFIQPTPWVKLVVFSECLKIYQTVVWIDADALIINHSLSLEQIIAECPLDGRGFIVSGNECDPWPSLNTGFWIIKNTSFSHRALSVILNYSRNEDVRNYRGWYEQYSVIKLYQEEESSRKFVCITPSSLSWFPVVLKKQRVINCQTRKPDNFLVHWAGAHWTTDHIFMNTGQDNSSMVPNKTTGIVMKEEGKF